MYRLSILVILFIVAACAPIRVQHDYEKGTNFTQYKTYNYYGELQTGMNELDNKRLISAIDANLKDKGLLISDDPDFYIDIKTDSYQDLNRGNTVGVGVGGTGRNVGGGVSVGIPLGNSRENRRIILDFRDENGIGLFWQGISESSYDPGAEPEERISKFKAIADKLLANYPPKNKSN